MSIESILKFIELIGLMLFVSSIGAQGWIAFLDIAEYFTNKLEKFRPEKLHDKYSRIIIIIGIFILLS